jgi:hypothetical protein
MRKIKREKNRKVKCEGTQVECSVKVARDPALSRMLLRSRNRKFDEKEDQDTTRQNRTDEEDYDVTRWTKIHHKRTPTTPPKVESGWTDWLKPHPKIREEERWKQEAQLKAWKEKYHPDGATYWVNNPDNSRAIQIIWKEGYRTRGGEGARKEHYWQEHLTEATDEDITKTNPKFAVQTREQKKETTIGRTKIYETKPTRNSLQDKPAFTPRARREKKKKWVDTRSKEEVEREEDEVYLYNEKWTREEKLAKMDDWMDMGKVWCRPKRKQTVAEIQRAKFESPSGSDWSEEDEPARRTKTQRPQPRRPKPPPDRLEGEVRMLWHIRESLRDAGRKEREEKPSGTGQPPDSPWGTELAEVDAIALSKRQPILTAMITLHEWREMVQEELRNWARGRCNSSAGNKKISDILEIGERIDHLPWGLAGHRGVADRKFESEVRKALWKKETKFYEQRD